MVSLCLSTRVPVNTVPVPVNTGAVPVIGGPVPVNTGAVPVPVNTGAVLVIAYALYISIDARAGSSRQRGWGGMQSEKMRSSG